jgi:hypothetical protein
VLFNEPQQMGLRNLVFQAEVIEQSFRAVVLPHHDQQASDDQNPTEHGQMFSSTMLLPNLIPLIGVTFSTPTPSPQRVALTGVGTAVQLTPVDLGFGNQPIGTTSLAKTITLSNKSHATVNITSIGIAGADLGDFSETNTCGKSVTSGASCFIKVCNVLGINKRVRFEPNQVRGKYCYGATLDKKAVSDPCTGSRDHNVAVA